MTVFPFASLNICETRHRAYAFLNTPVLSMPLLVYATPHVLRHAYAKSLIDSGVSLDKVATLLGHSNLNTTRIYTTPGVQDLEEAIGELDNW